MPLGKDDTAWGDWYTLQSKVPWGSATDINCCRCGKPVSGVETDTDGYPDVTLPCVSSLFSGLPPRDRLKPCGCVVPRWWSAPIQTELYYRSVSRVPRTLPLRMSEQARQTRIDALTVGLSLLYSSQANALSAHEHVQASRWITIVCEELFVLDACKPSPKASLQWHINSDHSYLNYAEKYYGVDLQYAPGRELASSDTVSEDFYKYVFSQMGIPSALLSPPSLPSLPPAVPLHVREANDAIRTIDDHTDKALELLGVALARGCNLPGELKCSQHQLVAVRQILVKRAAENPPKTLLGEPIRLFVAACGDFLLKYVPPPPQPVKAPRAPRRRTIRKIDE